MTTTRKVLTDNEEALPCMMGEFTGTDEATVIFNLRQDGKYLVPAMSDGGAGLVHGDQERGFYLAIKPGTIWTVRLKLSDDWVWSFDDNPISLKRQQHAQYYKLLDVKPQEITVQIKSRFPQAIPEPWPEEKQPFNLYLLMWQSAEKHFALMIDPDVKNPPPGGGRKPREPKHHDPIS